MASAELSSSSEDLSLKIRRGTSNSRDSFYMEFDKGIDSDIEEVSTEITTNLTPAEIVITTQPIPIATVMPLSAPVGGPLPTPPPLPTTDSDSPISDEEAPSISEGRKRIRRKRSSSSWAGPKGTSSSDGGATTSVSILRAHLPSPTNPSASVVSPETMSISQNSTPPNNRPRQLPNGLTLGNVTICPTDLYSDPSATVMENLSHLYHTTPPSTPTSPTPILKTKKHARTVGCDPKNEWKREGKEALSILLSALYGKLLVVMGIAFPMAEVISTYIPSTFYEGFYLYLYFGSILYMVYVYASILREDLSISPAVRSAFNRMRLASDRSEKSLGNLSRHTDDTEVSLSGSEYNGNDIKASPYPKQFTHFGSFYLRMGAVAFGIGSMIYSGLEFGQYFELEPDTRCHNMLLALAPATRMAFTFIQMYFIFLNAKMAVYRFKTVAQFGLMHMIGTNLCVWFNVLVQETKHEILMFYNPDSNRTSQGGGHGAIASALSAVTSSPHHRVARGLKGPYTIYECRRTDIMGSLVQNASPFLFPCTIEYSLICAAILYVMWKNINRFHARQRRGSLSHVAPKRSPHHYSVDCTKANKGLFVGILLLVLTIIGLILFFVLINRPEYRGLAVVEANITELIMYCATTLAVFLGMYQIRELKFDARRNLELDNILLVVAQTGTFIYNTFTIIGGHFTIKKNTVLVLVTALCSLAQALIQTIFILTASKRRVHNSDLARRKPGREVITFLLVTNLAMWAINTLEKTRAEAHPIQLHFYGLWAWTIITHISMPLAIFYRFHSTVCLCDIWKRAYKYKPTYM